MEPPNALLPFVVVAGVVVLPFLLFVSGCGSGGCINVALSPLLFVDVVGFISAGVDGGTPMLFVFVVSGCGGGGCIDVSSTLLFVDIGCCNSAGLEAVPVVITAMGAPIVVLAMEPPDALLPFVVAVHSSSWQWGRPLLFQQWSHPCPFWSS
jgi:hypothetical protein